MGDTEDVSGRRSERERGIRARRAREGSIVEWPGRRPPELGSLPTAVKKEPYLPLWVAAARSILLDTAKHYRAIICFADLGELVEARMDRRGPSYWHWMRCTLQSVAADCTNRHEPLLSSLCVNDDKSIVTGFGDSIRGMSESDDIEAHAARERMRCYRHFGAIDLPPDAGLSVRSGQTLNMRLTWAAHVAAERREHELEVDAARHREAARRHHQMNVEARKRFRQAMPGAIVDVYFDGNEVDAATFVIALDTTIPWVRGLDVVSIESPLGKTLIGAQVGESRSYKVFSDRTVHVTLVNSRPCDGYPFATSTNS